MILLFIHGLIFHYKLLLCKFYKKITTLVDNNMYIHNAFIKLFILLLKVELLVF